MSSLKLPGAQMAREGDLAQTRQYYHFFGQSPNWKAERMHMRSHTKSNFPLFCKQCQKLQCRPFEIGAMK